MQPISEAEIGDVVAINDRSPRDGRRSVVLDAVQDGEQRVELAGQVRVSPCGRGRRRWRWPFVVGHGLLSLFGVCVGSTTAYDGNRTLSRNEERILTESPKGGSIVVGFSFIESLRTEARVCDW